MRLQNGMMVFKITMVLLVIISSLWLYTKYLNKELKRTEVINKETKIELKIVKKKIAIDDNISFEYLKKAKIIDTKVYEVITENNHSLKIDRLWELHNEGEQLW